MLISTRGRYALKIMMDLALVDIFMRSLLSFPDYTIGLVGIQYLLQTFIKLY